MEIAEVYCPKTGEYCPCLPKTLANMMCQDIQISALYEVNE